MGTDEQNAELARTVLLSDVLAEKLVALVDAKRAEEAAAKQAAAEKTARELERTRADVRTAATAFMVSIGHGELMSVATMTVPGFDDDYGETCSVNFALPGFRVFGVTLQHTGQWSDAQEDYGKCQGPEFWRPLRGRRGGSELPFHAYGEGERISFFASLVEALDFARIDTPHGPPSIPDAVEIVLPPDGRPDEAVYPEFAFMLNPTAGGSLEVLYADGMATVRILDDREVELARISVDFLSLHKAVSVTAASILEDALRVDDEDEDDDQGDEDDDSELDY